MVDILTGLRVSEEDEIVGISVTDHRISLFLFHNRLQAAADTRYRGTATIQQSGCPAGRSAQ